MPPTLMKQLPFSKSASTKGQAFFLGFIATVVQIVFLRELVTVFYGNEIAYAVILGGWLFWVSLGSYLSGFLAQKIPDVRLWIFRIHFFLFLLLPTTLVLVRALKQILHLPTGEVFGVWGMTLCCFFILAPLTFLFGSLYPFLCRPFEADPSSKKTREDPLAHVNRVYLWESLGAAIAGLVASFILIRFFPATHIILFFCPLGVLVSLVWVDKRKRAPFVAAILATSMAFAFGAGAVDKVDQWTRRIQWDGFNVVSVTDSVYGNIVVTRQGDAYSLFENGLHSFTTQDPLTSEESVHFPLLEHPSPRRVLLIGNGLGGAVAEILKYPSLTRLDYVELDPEVIRAAFRFFPEKDLAALHDPRVRIMPLDGRFFVKRAQDKYDVVLVNLGDPHTAMINRYYTVEFFQEVRRILSRNGIVSLGVSSSENYVNTETRAFLRSIHSTLAEVFLSVRSIPGDTNIFLASPQPGVLTIDPAVYARRLKARNIPTQYVREYYLPFKLSDERLAGIDTILKEKGAINTDARPIAYLLNITLWSTHFDTGFKTLVERIRGVKLRHLLVLPLILLPVGLILKRKRPTFPVTLSIFTTGFSEIVYQIVVILMFQSLYGYVYQRIGLIVASFMGGLCWGAYTTQKFSRTSPARLHRAYVVTQVGICLYPLILPLVFVFFSKAAVGTSMNQGLGVVFTLLPVLAGFMGGRQYPLAARLTAPKEDQRVARSAGILYAVDVVGAMVGAILTGIFLIPLLGLNVVMYFCAALNVAVLLLLRFGAKPR